MGWHRVVNNTLVHGTDDPNSISAASARLTSPSFPWWQRYLN